MRTPAHGERPLYWVGSAKRDLLGFPEPVKDGAGTALSVAQFGGNTARRRRGRERVPVYWRLWKIMPETRIAPSIPFASVGPFTCCTAFRRSRVGAFRHRNRMCNLLNSA
jgi:hypothetical protein